MTGSERGEVALWMAFERLDHAYLVRDDDAVQRELAIIELLRDEAADTVEAASRRAPTGDYSLLEQVRARLGTAVDELLQLPLVPALVRGAAPTTTVQGDATIGDEERQALGSGVEASAVINGVDLGVDIVGIAAQVEDRVRVLVERDGDLEPVPLISTTPGVGILSSTVPWNAGLPARLIVAILADPASHEPR